MILDCWGSSSVAAEAIESLDYPEMGDRKRKSRPGDKVGFFTSGFGVSWTTAIVLSENADLANESSVKVDGCFQSFGIFSSLFMRHFLDIVAYTDKLAISMSAEFHFIRLTQTEQNHVRDDRGILFTGEFCGTLSEEANPGG
jgi:hypothetical protein